MVKAQDMDLPHLEFAEGAAPGTPASAVTRIYAKADGLMYSKDDAGTETLMSGGTGTLSDHTHAATGSGATGGGATLNPVTLKLPSAMGTTEGQADWDTTLKRFEVYDTQRERGVGDNGWAPFAWPLQWSAAAALTTTLSLPAVGGSIAIPMFVPAHMMSRGIAILNNDTGTARSCEIRLFQQYLNNGNGSENTLAEVAGTDGTDSFTPGGAASVRGITFSALPVYLAPGIYWLVVRNTHATSTWGLGSTAVGSSTFISNTAQTKTLGSSLTTTLDFVAATWTKVTAIYGVKIVGNVFGTTSSF